MKLNANAFGNALGSSLAEKMHTLSAAERQQAMFKKMDAEMADIIKNGDRRAANTPYIPGVGSWSGDGEIMQDFDPTGRVYANDNEYDNRSGKSTSALSGPIDPDMQRVIVPGTRMTAQEQEDFDKDAMRRSMLPYLQQPKRAKASVVQPRQSKANQALERQWNAAKDRLVTASHRAKVDPGVVAKIAAFESRFNPDAQPISSNASLNRVRQFDGTMAISSAHGYGQFTDAGWTDSIRRYGDEYGIDGAKRLSNAGAAAFRTNEDMQAAMLAEFTKANVARGRQLGGPNDDANVYALHNLGSGDGPKFLRALANDPSTPVDEVLSRTVVRGNPSLYGDGSITLRDAYNRMGNVMAAGDRFAVEARALYLTKFGKK